MLLISILLNIILIVGGVLTWLKIPNWLLEHYKSKLAQINQQKINEFNYHTQQQQQKFEEKLQSTLAEQKRDFEQKAELLKQRRTIIPIIYAKLLELNGAVRQEENSKKREIQININNYIESQRLFLTEPLYKEIKSVQKSMGSISAIYETMSKIEGQVVETYNREKDTLEETITQQLTKLENDFRNTMFGK